MFMVHMCCCFRVSCSWPI